jgi:hypothetical protein
MYISLYLIGSLSQLSIQGSAAETTVFFPASMDKMQTAEYTYSQTMVHWVDGTFIGTGSIKMAYDHNITGRIGLTGIYDIKAWQRACDVPSYFTGTVQTSNNRTTRYTIGTVKTIGSMNLNGMHSNLYLGDYMDPATPKEYFLDDLMYIRAITVQSVFDWAGETFISVMGTTLSAYHIHWKGQIVYLGYICGIGAYPLINCTADYYYEKQSGLLLATEAQFIDYLSSDPEVQQKHTISKRLISLKYEGQPVEKDDRNLLDSFLDRLFGENRRQAEAIMGIIAIIGAGLIAIHLINKRSLKWRSQALVEFEKKYGNLETIIEETKQELAESLKEPESNENNVPNSEDP